MSLQVSRWSPAEIVTPAIPEDERLWVPTANPGVHIRPLLFDTGRGAWVNVTRIRTEGLITRHAHPCPVHAHVLKGQWHYAERDRPVVAGDYLYEPAGDIHTLMGHAEESLTMFWITGTLVELDADGRTTGYADVFTRIAQAERHFEAVGLGADHVREYLR